MDAACSQLCESAPTRNQAMRMLHDKHLLPSVQFALKAKEDRIATEKRTRDIHRAMQVVASGQATDEDIGYKDTPPLQRDFDLDLAREELYTAHAMYVCAIKRKRKEMETLKKEQ